MEPQHTGQGVAAEKGKDLAAASPLDVSRTARMVVTGGKRSSPEPAVESRCDGAVDAHEPVHESF